MSKKYAFKPQYKIYSENIRSLNKIRFKGLEKFQCGYTLAEVNGFIVLKKRESLILLMKKFLFLIFFHNQGFVFHRHNSSILFYGHYERPDNREIMTKIATTTSICDWCEPIVKKRKLTLKKLHHIRLCCFWFTQMSSLQGSMISKMMYITRLLSAKVFLEAFKESCQPQKYKLLVTLADFQLQANIVTQYFSLHNVATATLQDGNPIKKPKYISAPQQFMPAFNALVSDYYLAWGEYYKEVAVSWSVDIDKIVCLGMPKYISKTTKPILNIKSTLFAVLLDNDSNIVDNYNLIQDAEYIAEKMNLKYVIRLHPASDIRHYEKYQKNIYCCSICEKNKTVSEFLENKAFAVGCSSAVLIEGMLSCAIILRRLPNFSVFDYLKDVNFPLEYSFKEEAVNLVVNAFKQYSKGLENKLSAYREKMCGKGNYEESYSRFFEKLAITP